MSHQQHKKTPSGLSCGLAVAVTLALERCRRGGSVGGPFPTDWIALRFKSHAGEV